MTDVPEMLNPTVDTPLQSLTRRSYRQLLRVFWCIAIALVTLELFWTETDSLLSNIAALCITVAALFPSYLWCAGRVQGIPIFPLFALTFVWTYALPLVSNHSSVELYSPAKHLIAGLTTAGCLALATFVWLKFVQSPPPVPRVYRALSSQKGDRFFFTILGLGVLFNLYMTGGWFALDLGFFALLRNAILGLTALSTFVLSYRLGTQELSTSQSYGVLVLLSAYIITSAAGLLLVTSASIFLIAVAAFIIGRRKVPVPLIAIGLIFLTFLHYGKAEMRAKYWAANQLLYVQPWQYPAWFTEWGDYSLNYLSRQDNVATVERKQSLFERSSIIHLLLLVQDKSPDSIPYLNGQTYAIVPELIVPRFLNSKKIRSHEGTYLLNIHYGLQTREATLKTTIGWGLLAEAYANFSFAGCAGLAIVWGSIYGQVTRWSLNAPILSAQSLFAVLIMTFAFQTEWSAGVYAAALFQSTTVLIGLNLLVMDTYTVKPSP